MFTPLEILYKGLVTVFLTGPVGKIFSNWTEFKSVFSLALISFLGFVGVCFGEVPAGIDVSTNQVEEVLWIDGRLPPMSEAEGRWLWDKDMKQAGVISHTDEIVEGAQRHSFRTDAVIKLNKDSRIIQYVFLDPKNPPSGIMIKFFQDGDKQIAVYWEGEEEVFGDTDEYITAWYMNPLPKNGQWIGLEIDCQELDITEARLDGICFITNDGRLWWGRTVIVQSKN